MALTGSDLVRIAELIALGAQTAAMFGVEEADGKGSVVVELAKRIEAAAEELADIGRGMEPA